MKDSKSIQILSGLVLFFISTGSYANLVQNGGFENGNFVEVTAGYMIINPGDTALTSWTAVNEGVAWGLPGDSAAASGIGFVDLSEFGANSPNSQLQQSLSTSIGTQYIFSYDQKGASEVVLGGTLLALTAGATSNGWTTFTSMFTATSTLSLLSLNNLGTNNPIVFVDNVSLTEIDISAVPVPAAVWLFGTALVGLIGYGKRRKVA